MKQLLFLFIGSLTLSLSNAQPVDTTPGIAMNDSFILNPKKSSGGYKKITQAMLIKMQTEDIKEAPARALAKAKGADISSEQKVASSADAKSQQAESNNLSNASAPVGQIDKSFRGVNETEEDSSFTNPNDAKVQAVINWFKYKKGLK